MQITRRSFFSPSYPAMFVSFLAALGGVVPISTASGQCRTVEKLVALDGRDSDLFGNDVDISGDLIVVGAVGHDMQIQSGGIGDESIVMGDIGAAYIYRYNPGTGDWDQETSLTPPLPEEGDHFGVSVATDGTVAVVGADRKDGVGPNTGAAFVYRYDGTSWNYETTLSASDGESQDLFGRCLDIDGDYIVVGADHDDDGFRNSGSVYVYHYDGTSWNEQAKLRTSDAAIADFFGKSVSISGTRIVVGAYLDDVNETRNTGSAYVFRYDGVAWTEEAKLTASDAEKQQYFGRSVSISGTRVVVGANGTGASAGAAYVYQFDEGTGHWMENVKLEPVGLSGGDQFGMAVHLDGDMLIIGAPHDDNNASGTSGTAYVCRSNGSTWVQEDQLAAPESPPVVDQFGYALAVTQGVLVIGSRNSESTGGATGAVYVFGTPDTDCNVNGSSDACDISLGLSADANANGVPDECETAVPGDLNADGLVNIQDMLLLLTDWGPCAGCSADLDGSGIVDILDLLILLGNWT